MRYLSVCSGIEAASVAWESFGWTPVGFAEIERFPSEVLAARFPGVRNFGDMTRFREWDIERNSVDVLVGGTPCQSFSVAGLRKGLDDPRGNLALTFLAMVDHYRPEWVIWENVPGVLSSNGGRDFGSFLGALGQLGYGFSYRVLDAQYFGVPQRRRRVFVVGHSSGDPRRAAEVLFEPESLRGNPAPSKPQRKETSYSFASGSRIGSAKVAGTLCALDGPNGVSDQYAHEAKLIIMADGQSNAAVSTNEIAPTLNSSTENPIIAHHVLVSETSHCILAGSGMRHDPHTETLIPVQHAYRKSARPTCKDGFESWVDDGVANTLNCFDIGDIQSTNIAVQAAIPIQDVRPIDKGQNGMGIGQEGDPSYTLDKMATQGVAHTYPINTLTIGGRPDPINDARMALGIGDDGDPQYTLLSNHSHAVAHNMVVRRLTPVECERLQGFPDGWTDIRDNTPDGPRYKAIGNSMAVPVMRWIGQRIQAVCK